MKQQCDETSTLAALYHINSKLMPNIIPVATLSQEELMLGAEGQAVKSYVGIPTISLPTHREVNPITHSICTRRSVRDWSAQSIDITMLSTLLQLSTGVIERTTLNGKTTYYRSTPSGGARYPIEVYPVVLRVEGLDKGLYHYNPHNHSLDILQLYDDVETHIASSTTYPDFVQGSAVVFVFTAIFERSMSKYLERGYRYIFLEAGHIAQNICLLASSLGLGSLCIAGYYDQIVERILRVDGVSESVIYLLAVGHSNTSKSHINERAEYNHNQEE